MSEQSASAKSPELFARKGSARPAGTLIHYERAVALREAKRAKETEDKAEEGAETGAEAAADNGDQIELDLKSKEAGKPGKARSRKTKTKAGASEQGTDPAGSLLTIPFRRLEQQARGIPAESKAGETSDPKAPPKVPLKKRAAAPFLPPAANTGGGPERSSSPGSPATPSTAAPPRPVPGPAAGRSPGFARETRAAVGLGLLAALGVALGLWYTMQESRTVSVETAPPSEPAASDPAPTAPVEAPADKTPADEAAADPKGEAPPDAAAETAADSITPSFDLIRIEPTGEAVMAGRAAPDTELILLDNGKPIGVVTADWSGEWAFIPDKPLAVGDHRFSLVVSTPQGTVTIPAPDAEDAAEEGDTLDGAIDGIKGETATEPDKQSSLEVPPRKPDASQLEPGYDVQLSSTTTRKGAMQELTKLQRSFPTLLGDKVLFVQEARIDGTDTRFRIRTGPFADLDPARELCAEFRSLKQDCLVIER